jgi:hypothetical protein
MLITVNTVEVKKMPKGYQVAEVGFTHNGEAKARKIMSFASPKVFSTLTQMVSELPKDVNIRMEKNEKSGYWDWLEVETSLGGGTDGNKSEAKAPAGRVTGSNYETKEERAKRQVYIIRQSSLANAIAYFAAANPKGTEATPKAVIDLASEFTDFVLGQELDVAADVG